MACVGFRGSPLSQSELSCLVEIPVDALTWIAASLEEGSEPPVDYRLTSDGRPVHVGSARHGGSGPPYMRI
jgi:hypothetical protein